ncbi:MAG: hypothetical protein WAS05_08875 [Candidatus Nanopelagicales bacterium]
MSIQKKAVNLVGMGALVGATMTGVGVASMTSVAAAPAAPKAAVAKVKIKAPKTVTAGKTFRLKCSVSPKSAAKDWRGSTAVVHEKRVPVHASRVVTKNGGCSMRLILNAKGKKKLSVVLLSPGGGSLGSKWINIKVK